MENPVLNLAKP